MSKAKKLESPYIIVKLLNVLKGFYTFKELEEKIGIPSQVLWRYTSLVNIPEKKTARKIIEKIEEYDLIKNVINRTVVQNSYGYVESWRYLYDIHFLGLVGYEAAKFVKDYDVDVVLAFPQEDAPLALAVSEWLGCRACIGFTRLGIEVGKYLQASYVSLDRKRIMNVYVPGNVIGKGDGVFIVKNVAKDWASLRALSNVINEVGAYIFGLLVVASVSNEWKRTVECYMIKRVKVLKNLEH